MSRDPVVEKLPSALQTVQNASTVNQRKKYGSNWHRSRGQRILINAVRISEIKCHLVIDDVAQVKIIKYCASMKSHFDISILAATFRIVLLVLLKFSEFNVHLSAFLISDSKFLIILQ